MDIDQFAKFLLCYAISVGAGAACVMLGAKILDNHNHTGYDVLLNDNVGAKAGALGNTLTLPAARLFSFLCFKNENDHTSLESLCTIVVGIFMSTAAVHILADNLNIEDPDETGLKAAASYAVGLPIIVLSLIALFIIYTCYKGCKKDTDNNLDFSYV